MPDWNHEIRRHLEGLRLPATREVEIIEELAQHAEDRYQELLRSGIGEADAQLVALREATEHLSDELRTVERTNASDAVTLGAGRPAHILSGLTQDIQYGLRALLNNPRFTVVAMLALALGIGANTAIFSVINGVILQPLAYHDPSRLMQVYEKTPEFTESSVPYFDYLDWRRLNRSFTDIGVHRGADFNYTGAGTPEQIAGEYVSASLFPVLGVAPVLGRHFVPEEDRPHTACSVILSYGMWKRRFAGDRGVLGKTIALNADSCAVIGVMPWNFRFGGDAEVYLPLENYNGVELRSREGSPGLHVVARLKQGVSPEAGQAEMVSIAKGLGQQYPATNATRSAKVIPMKDDMVSSIRNTLLMLAGAVGLVLIIACANVANLMLARSSGRRREFAIRAALGAERWRVVRQLLVESLLLSTGASLLGLALAWWGTKAVLAAAPGSVPRAGEVGIDPYVLLFTLGVAVLTGILFGVAPAWQGASVEAHESLKEGARGAGGGRHRREGVFVGAEIGLAIILLVGAGLMMRTMGRLLQVDPGFNSHNVLTMQVALSPRAIASASQIRLAFRQILDRVNAIPGVKASSLQTLVPLADNDNEIPFWPGIGPQPPQDKMLMAVMNMATPDYLKVLQIPLRRGRFFGESDRMGAIPVVVIDDVLAAHLFPDRDPVGQQISMMLIGPVRIVGVVGHVKQWGLDSDDSNPIRDQLYFPFWQVPDQFMASGVAGLTLTLRTEPEPLSLVEAVRKEVAGPGRDQPAYGIRTMERIVSGSVASRNFTMLVLMIFAGIALLLATIGIYSVTSYAVTRRTHELGVRAALGATRGEIVRLVLRQGMTPALVGMAFGLAAAIGLSRLMSHLLFGVSAADPVTLTGVTLLLGVVALLACYLPARRATAIDPISALRAE